MTDEAQERLEKLAASHEDAAKRFADYHATAVSWREESSWDKRAREDAQIASDIRTVLSTISTLTDRQGEIESWLNAHDAPTHDDDALLSLVGRIAAVEDEWRAAAAHADAVCRVQTVRAAARDAAIDEFVHAYRKRYSKPSTYGIKSGAPMREEVADLNALRLQSDRTNHE